MSLDLGGRIGPGWALAFSRSRAQTGVALAIIPMVAVTVALAVTSDHLQRPAAAALYFGYEVAASMAIGLYWWMRRPASRFGLLLIAFGALAWIVSWEGSSTPVVFDLGVLAEGPYWLMTIYLFLAFPLGRIEPRTARWIFAAMGLGVLALFYPWAFTSPVIAGGGPLTRCAPNCPENALMITADADVARVAGDAEVYAALTLTAAVFFVYLWRLLSASRPQRRALMAVAVTSLLFLPAYFIFNFAAWIVEIENLDTLDTLAWGIVGARILLPLGFLVALLQADIFAARVLLTLLERLAAHPTPAAWRDSIAEALDDRDLQLGFHDPGANQYRATSGDVVVPPAEGSGRAWVPVVRDGEPVAAMDLDEALTADPELVHAAAIATLLAVENGALEGELQASRARILEAGDAERRRIERDLHDSAQQRLVALRVRLALVSERLDATEERETIERLGGEVERAIDELRDVARGLYPQLLSQLGPGAALEALARRSPIPVHVSDDQLRRHSEAVETTVYFCCVECLQNAAKHAGPAATVEITLRDENGHLTFDVADDGIGFDLGQVERGAGLANLADRVAAVGGTLSIETHPGRGCHIKGAIPS
jgi:signal transduction histidine kinase